MTNFDVELFVRRREAEIARCIHPEWVMTSQVTDWLNRQYYRCAACGIVVPGEVIK